MNPITFETEIDRDVHGVAVCSVLKVTAVMHPADPIRGPEELEIVEVLERMDSGRWRDVTAWWMCDSAIVAEATERLKQE